LPIAEPLDWLRELTATHPALLCIATAALIGAARTIAAAAVARRAFDPVDRAGDANLASAASASPTDHRDWRRPSGVAVCVLAAYAAMAIAYLRSGAYADLAEPTIAAVSWLVRLGQSPYHGVDAPARYAHIYGPGLFLIQAAMFRALGAGIWVSKVAGVLAALGSLVFLAAALKASRDWRGTLRWTALAALVFLMFGNISFWIRAEPLLLLCASAALLCALQRHWLVAAVGVGIAMGVAMNLKATGVCYIVPVVPLIIARHPGRVAALLIVSGTAVVAIAWVPFAIWPQIAFGDYRFWLQQSSENGLRVRLLRPNIEWALYLALPLGLSLFVRERLARAPDLWSLITLCAAMGLIVVLAAKPGAGPYHLLPFVPVIIWLGATLHAGVSDTVRSWWTQAVATFILPALIITGIQQWLLIETLRVAAREHVARDIEAFADTRPGARIEMGYGGTSGYNGSAPLTFYRPLLVFRSGTYLLDAPGVQEHQLAGIEVPATTLQAIARCDVTYWLIPRGEEPFATRNMYAATGFRPLFSQEFRRTFFEAYRRTASTDYFDVYSCIGPRHATVR
jgi:hypothetical protein